MSQEPFLNRKDELARLNQAWAAAAGGNPQLVMVWGRRRVGKTYLLTHFLRGKRGVFFPATQQAAAIELARLAEATRRDLPDHEAELAGGSFAEWEAALRFFAALAREQPLVLVIDEVPYLARSTPGFASIVQSVWDHVRKGTKFMLVLTGSAVGVVESMLGSGGALRGRPTLALRMDPLDPWSAREFLPHMSAPSFVEAYAACGGYPLHLKAWNGREGLDANLLRLAGSSGGVLLEDATAILSEELPESGGYARILAAIGRGSTRYSEIANEVGQRIEHPLEVLRRSGFVRKAVPVGSPKGARANYELNDAYLAFWFRVLYSDVALIEGGQGRPVLDRARPRWQNHLGKVFEEVARQHAQRLAASGELPSDIIVGRWWSASGEPCEVDVLGLRGKRTVLLGEARWQSSPLGSRDIASLKAKIDRVPSPAQELILAFWSRGGIREKLLEKGLVSFDVRSMIDG